MPELPEVEVMRRSIEAHVLNVGLVDVKALDKRLTASMLPNWDRSLIGNPLSETRRTGKYLFLQFGESWLHLHFGMTGSIVFVPNGEHVPKYTRLALNFDNGLQMCFTDPRTFGKMDVVNRVDAFLSTKKLGRDLLDATDEDAKKMFSKRKISAKAILLKQKEVAGIGNWLADEALFRQNIHPATPGGMLSEKKANDLLKETKRIAIEAIDTDTHYGDFPKHFFVHHRKENASCPCGDGTIEKLTLAGRSTYFCNTCQTHQS